MRNILLNTTFFLVLLFLSDTVLNGQEIDVLKNLVDQPTENNSIGQAAPTPNSLSWNGVRKYTQEQYSKERRPNQVSSSTQTTPSQITPSQITTHSNSQPTWNTNLTPIPPTPGNYSAPSPYPGRYDTNLYLTDGKAAIPYRPTSVTSPGGVSDERNPFSSDHSFPVMDKAPVEDLSYGNFILENPAQRELLADSQDRYAINKGIGGTEETLRVAATIPSNRFDGSKQFPHSANASKTLPIHPATGKALDSQTAEPTIDLSPSYSKKLEHVEICGVVVVQANFPLTEIKSILKEIELLQQDLGLYMGIPKAKEKIELCLFKDEASYKKFLREQFPNAPRDRRALYIKMNNDPGTLLVQRSADFEVDLRHEMTHAIIHASIPVVPIWLDEGLAKYFEVPVGQRSEQHPYIKTIRWNVRFGAVPSMKRLERLVDITEMGNREYRDSWAWVHFMIHHSPDTHRLLAGYLRLIHRLQEEATIQGKPMSKSAELPTLGPYLEDVLKKPREKYREHFQTWGVPKDE